MSRQPKKPPVDQETKGFLSLREAFMGRQVMRLSAVLPALLSFAYIYQNTSMSKETIASNFDAIRAGIADCNTTALVKEVANNLTAGDDKSFQSNFTQLLESVNQKLTDNPDLLALVDTMKQYTLDTQHQYNTLRGVAIGIPLFVVLWWLVIDYAKQLKEAFNFANTKQCLTAGTLASAWLLYLGFRAYTCFSDIPNPGQGFACSQADDPVVAVLNNLLIQGGFTLLGSTAMRLVNSLFRQGSKKTLEGISNGAGALYGHAQTQVYSGWTKVATLFRSADGQMVLQEEKDGGKNPGYQALNNDQQQQLPSSDGNRGSVQDPDTNLDNNSGCRIA